MASVRTADTIQRPLAVTVPVATQLLGFKDTKKRLHAHQTGQNQAANQAYFPDQLQITGRLRRRMLKSVTRKENACR